MRVEIRARHGKLRWSLEEQLKRRLHFALARFGGRVRQATILPADLNGPSGGEDQHCRIKVSLVPSGSIMAKAADAGVASAAGRAAERVARRLRDALDRKRTMREPTDSPPSEDDAPPGL